MKRYKLGDKHPFNERVSKLMAYANELGISIDFSACQNRTWITDEKTDEEYELVDVDTNNPVKNFPAFTEYKIVYDK